MIISILLVVAVLVLFFGAVSFIGAPYVPSQKKYIKRVFKYLKLGAHDVLVDVGSGDGVVLRVASKFGATAIGYEINPVLVLISKLLSFGDRRVSISLENFWSAKLPDDTTLVYVFSVTRDERKLIKLMQREADRLGKPLKLLCHASPFHQMEAVDTFEAYSVYVFYPLQLKNA